MLIKGNKNKALAKIQFACVHKVLHYNYVTFKNIHKNILVV